MARIVLIRVKKRHSPPSENIDCKRQKCQNNEAQSNPIEIEGGPISDSIEVNTQPELASRLGPEPEPQPQPQPEPPQQPETAEQMAELREKFEHQTTLTKELMVHITKLTRQIEHNDSLEAQRLGMIINLKSAYKELEEFEEDLEKKVILQNRELRKKAKQIAKLEHTNNSQKQQIAKLQQQLNKSSRGISIPGINVFMDMSGVDPTRLP